MSPSAEARQAMRRELLRWLHWLAAATVALYVATIAIAGAVVHQSRVAADESSRTKAALCTYRRNLQQAADSSARFLQAHPQGVAGISPEVIQQGIDRQRATVATLAVLKCPREARSR
jgi:hypothetical protein